MNNKAQYPIEVYSDGSSIGNPGPSGAAYIIRYYEEINGDFILREIEKVKGFRLSTNNRMEIISATDALEEIRAMIAAETIKGAITINLFSDSKYFCDAINLRWVDKWEENNWVTSTQTPVKNRDLWEYTIKTIEALKQFGCQININHIPGHKGYKFNEICDKLANNAARSQNDQLIDEVYESQNKR